MQVELEELELVDVPVSINEDELARAIVKITLHCSVEWAIVHDLILNRLLPHPNLHVFRIDQVALVLLSGHWDVNGRLSRAIRLIIKLDNTKLPCRSLHPSNRHHW
jgi:hypothetical protein